MYMRCLVLLASASPLAAMLQLPTRNVRRCTSPLRRHTPPISKLRERVDFGGSDAGAQEFGLQGHVFGLAPTADSGVLLFLAAVVARSHRLPAADVAFAVGYPAYLLLANRLRFDGGRLDYDSMGSSSFKPLLRDGRGPWFKRYVFAYALAGLLLPLPFTFAAPPAVAAAAAPHLFLTACQCAFESLTSHARFSALLRLAVPIGFNAYRLSALRVWTSNALLAARSGGGAWAWSALALALANSAVWTYNLFVFLLLRVAPQYLDPVEFPSPKKRWRWALLPVAPPEVEEGSPDARTAVSGR